MKDSRIDDYIENAQAFARPILKKLRALIHKACPEVTETIKWGMPSFEYKGHMCGFASFKQHCAFGFWKTKLIKDSSGYLQKHKAAGGEGMGNLGRITSTKDLPPDKVLFDFIKQAAKLNEDGVKVKKAAPKLKKEIPVPAEFQSMLNKNKKAKTTFDSFAPSHRREYLEWITEAKTEATQLKRMTTALEWISEGKQRNWKYMKK